VGAPVVQVGNKVAEVCHMGSVAYCRTSSAALRAVALEQTRLAASHHGMRPTLLLVVMIKCGVMAWGECGEAKCLPWRGE